MARKRKTIDGDRIVALMRGGRTAEKIAEVLAAEGVHVSRATITRRMRELKGKANAGRAAARVTPPAQVDEVPDVVPDGTELAIVDKWIPKVEAAAEAAEAEGDLTAFASLTAKLVTLLEHRRKAAPPPRADPNESPDMVAAAKRAREMLHRLIVTSPEAP
jgi:hypothetical protein